MAGNTPAYSDLGTYVQNTFNLNIRKIESIDVNSDDFKKLLVDLYQDLNKMCIALNLKTSGYFPLVEFVDGNVWFPVAPDSTTQSEPIYRQEFCKVINFGTLPNTGSKSVAHGIVFDANTIFTQIYATATSPTTLEAKPIPYVNPVNLADAILIDVDATNVIITTAGDYSRFTICYVVLKYLKN